MELTAEEQRELVDKAIEAVTRDRIVVGGGWSRRRPRKAMYRGGVFDHRGKKWSACRGEQRPGYARLMDATACLMVREGAEYSVALLDPSSTNKWSLPGASYHRDFTRAAWAGLRILWSPAELPGAPVAIEAPGARTRFAVLDAVAAEIRQSAAREWFEAKSSKGAEPHIRAVVHGVLQAHGFEQRAKRFTSYWRNAETDGTWRRTQIDDALPNAISLEVKVSEDLDAPFGQIVDDLGGHGAVVHVRILKSERDRERLYDDPELGKLRQQFEEALPVAFVTLRRCARCANPLVDAEER